MSSNPLPSLTCSVVTAHPFDVAKAFHDLSRDMDPNCVHVFLDKLQRYAAKPDRALFLAEFENRTIAFATIIDQAPPPAELDTPAVERLKEYACGTGLMVLPEFRKRHVATNLVNHWENWAITNERKGIWVITHKMAGWYQRYFAYSIHGATIRHGVKKTILVKSFHHSTAS